MGLRSIGGSGRPAGSAGPCDFGGPGWLQLATMTHIDTTVGNRTIAAIAAGTLRGAEVLFPLCVDQVTTPRTQNLRGAKTGTIFGRGGLATKRRVRSRRAVAPARSRQGGHAPQTLNLRRPRAVDRLRHRGLARRPIAQQYDRKRASAAAGS